MQDFKRPGKIPSKEKIGIEMISDELNLHAGSQYLIQSAKLLNNEWAKFYMLYIINL